MVGRKRSRPPKPPPASLTAHQVVAYNFARAREARGWTQVETSEQLALFLGYRLNQAGVSAIEKTYDSERRRNIDVAEIVAYSRCFGFPIGWFFLPPAGHTDDLIEPVQTGELERVNLDTAHLLALVLGTPGGWNQFVERVVELLHEAPESMAAALRLAFRGEHDEQGWEKQIDLRRRALRETTLVRQAGPGEEVISKMASLLVDLVKLTPLGFELLRDSDPQEALRLLTLGDADVQNLLRMAREQRLQGVRGHGGFDDLEDIDPVEVLNLKDDPGATEP
ncbi:MAG: helix-turn-helix domain-containing protein [Ilumatobacteraceae bacterium]